jgi:hypothetical protein
MGVMAVWCKYPSALNILFFGREKTPKAISPTILYWGGRRGWRGNGQGFGGGVKNCVKKAENGGMACRPKSARYNSGETAALKRHRKIEGNKNKEFCQPLEVHRVSGSEARDAVI